MTAGSGLNLFLTVKRILQQEITHIFMTAKLDTQTTVRSFNNTPLGGSELGLTKNLLMKKQPWQLVKLYCSITSNPVYIYIFSYIYDFVQMNFINCKNYKIAILLPRSTGFTCRIMKQYFNLQLRSQHMHLVICQLLPHKCFLFRQSPEIL